MGVNRYKGTCSSNAALVNKYVGTAYDHVKTVSDNIEDVKTIADALGEEFPESGLDTLVENINDVVTVATNIEDVDTVAGIKDVVVTVAGIEQEIIDVPSYTAQAIDAANAAEEDADRAETEADRSTTEADRSTTEADRATDAADTALEKFEATFAAQFAYMRIGNISDYVGQSLPEADKLNAYQYPDDSGNWYGPVQSQSFPITIPADPSNDDGWPLVNALTSDSLSLYTDIVYKASGGNSAVENMIAGIPIAASVGDKCSTGGTLWIINGTAGSVAGFVDIGNSLGAFPLTDLCVDDWGADRKGVIDSSQNFNDALQAIGENSVVYGTHGSTYRIDEPIILNKRNQGLIGYGAKIDATNFNVGTNKGVIEALTRKNGVNLRGSREFVQIKGWTMQGDGVKRIAGVASSGFVRGSILQDNTIQGFYNGAQFSGSFTFIISNNIIQNNINCDLILGKDILIDVDGLGGYTDGGVNPVLVQEGYEYSPGKMSIQCNAATVIGNRFGGSKHGYSCHFGNAVNTNRNTFETATGVGLKITALESGELIGNYSEANAGWFFGRDSGGLVERLICHTSFFNATDLYFIGMNRSEFHTNNYSAGTNVKARGAYQRNASNRTDLPNPSNRADVGQLQNSYTYARDNKVQRTDETYLAHHGLFRTNLDESKLESGLTVTDMNNTGVPWAEITKDAPFKDVVTRTRQAVADIPVTIGSTDRSAMFIVQGEHSTTNTTRFIDIVLCIGFGGTTVIGSQERRGPSGRTYTMSSGNLQVSLASGEYLVSVRGFDGTNIDVASTQ